LQIVEVYVQIKGCKNKVIGIGRRFKY